MRLEEKMAPLFSTKTDTGIIIALKDGIGTILGLRAVNAGELVLSAKNYGVVLNLQTSVVGVVFLSEYNLRVGSFVQRMYQLISLPVTTFSVGKVLSALGTDVSIPALKNIDFVSKIDAITQLVEIKAPDILARESIYEPVATGSKILDAIVPIGQGQRELIIGDRQTGKTALAIDSILNQ